MVRWLDLATTTIISNKQYFKKKENVRVGGVISISVRHSHQSTVCPLTTLPETGSMLSNRSISNSLSVILRRRYEEMVLRPFSSTRKVTRWPIASIVTGMPVAAYNPTYSHHRDDNNNRKNNECNSIGLGKMRWSSIQLKIGQEGMAATHPRITSANCMSVEVSGIE